MNKMKIDARHHFRYKMWSELRDLNLSLWANMSAAISDEELEELIRKEKHRLEFADKLEEIINY